MEVTKSGLQLLPPPIYSSVSDVTQSRRLRLKKLRRRQTGAFFSLVNLVLFLVFTGLAVYFFLLFWSHLPSPYLGSSNPIYFTAILRPHVVSPVVELDGTKSLRPTYGDDNQLVAVWGQVVFRREWIWNAGSHPVGAEDSPLLQKLLKPSNSVIPP